MVRIALVEDDPIYRNQLKEYLVRYEKESAEKIRITTFTDGDEIAIGYRAEYDIILMDIEMNYMDGMTAAEEIRRLDPEVVIIFITNSPQYAIKGYQNLPVTAIAPGAFAGAEKLEEITLQTGIRAIGDGAFRGCGSLMRIILESAVPSECRVGQKLLEGTEANVYVPAEALSAYRTDYFWSIFGSRIRPAV